MKSIKTFVNNSLKKIYNNLDYQTDKHIVVFESDDWGSIRMCRKEDWVKLKRMGYAVDKRPYERCDTLESATDLMALFDVLMRHKDSSGNYPIITMNMLMANPDFDRIKASKYGEYYYEPIANTYERYYGTVEVLDVMKQGLKNRLIMPQSHGREHFNVLQWMRGLQMGDEDLLNAFNFGMCGIAPKEHPDSGNQLMNALNLANREEQCYLDAIVSDGLFMFEKFWGFRSKTFCAPCYLWNKQTEKKLSEEGVELIQSTRKSKRAKFIPSRFFYSGQRNQYDQIYNIRNCKFEPSTDKIDNNVDALMKQLDNSFIHKKIAVFSTHRINYVGGLDIKNRERTLQLLDVLLSKILEKYPDVEFMSSNDLLKIFD